MHRRNLIRTAGLALVLPPLEGLGQFVDAPAKRLLTIVNHLSFYQPALLPSHGNPILLDNLTQHRENLRLFSGLDTPGVQLSTGHSPAVGVLSGYFNRLERTNRISFDQRAAELLGRETRFKSLALQAGENLNFSQICWDEHGMPVHQIDSPEEVFDQLFGVDPDHEIQQQILAEDKSILDLAYQQAKSLSEHLSGRDRDRLDQYFTSVREVEKSVRRKNFWSTQDKPHSEYHLPEYSRRSVDDYVQVMFDLAVLALQTDSTRVVTIQIPFWESFDQKDFSGNYHDFSHHGQKEDKIEKLLVMENMILRKVGQMLDRLKATQMSSGASLFDETTTLVTAAFGSASSHTFNNLPALYFNRSVKAFQHTATSEAPICSLYLSILQDLGVEIDVFGEGKSTLSLT
ncbi:MAG: DUF1552 domain-containing protein [Planctomycetales bacterium]|nr:DUF1552 domain-containing protein [Planctomycetales bacterium]